MSRIDRSASNIYPIPINCTVNQKTGYVLANVTNEYINKSHSNGSGYSSHVKLGIGYAVEPQNWKNNRYMYANRNYFIYFNKAHLPEAPEKNDNISIGLHVVLNQLCQESSLEKMLDQIFGVFDARLILDLAAYMISEESAKFQHFLHWAKGELLFSSCMRSDTYISTFLKERLTVSKINQFKKMWAVSNIGNGSIYVCYDSTNVNCQAEGVYLVQKGFAKDDASLNQVNTDYVVRQEDGLPLTFMQFPGSIVDIVQAPEMIRFFSQLGEDVTKNIAVICDRGYISERNIEELDKNGVDFLLMLRRDMSCCTKVLEKYAEQVKKNCNYIPEYDEFGITVREKIFGRKNEPERSITIIWNQQLETNHRRMLYAVIESKRKELDVAIKRKTQYSKQELEAKFSLFTLSVIPTGTIEVKKKGRGNADKVELLQAFIIENYSENDEKIDRALSHCGFRIMASSKEVTALESRVAYSKRDCVEKVFRSLKTSMGMDVIGVSCDDSIHGKSLIWFVASIIYSLLSSKLEHLRMQNRKKYTVPAAVRSLDEITADRDLNTNKYTRRYQFDKQQKAILGAFNISEAFIDEVVFNCKNR